MIKQEELNKILKNVIKEAQEVEIPVPAAIYPEVMINGRPKKRFGCCRRQNGMYQIEISRFVLDASVEAVRGVVAHEVLHTCPGCYEHGKIWKFYAAKMNEAYGYKIKRTSTFEELGLKKEEEDPARRIRYIIKCESCGREYPRQRYTCVMKKINAYRCSCGGRLSVYGCDPQGNWKKSKR